LTDLIIRNARIALPDGSLLEGDLACTQGKISKISAQLDLQARESIDAQGKTLLPGAIDPQVHFREPGNEHKEDLGSGSRAAVHGGVTSFLEMPNTSPSTTTQAALDEKLARASKKCVANYGFFIGATPDNLEVLNTASPVCGIKIFMGSSTGSLLVNKEKDLENIFAHGSRLIAVHAENEQRINERQAEFSGSHTPETHSLIRDNESFTYSAPLHQRRSGNAEAKQTRMGQCRGHPESPVTQCRRI
jgi:dihydroorotase